MADLIFTIDTGSTTPTLDAVLLEGGQIVSLVGASAQFTLLELGGDEIFTRSATIVSATGGHVRYAWQPGDTSTGGRYLGRFHITFASLEERDFPSERYVRVEVA